MRITSWFARQQRCVAAFSLVELIVVMAIVGGMVALLLVGVQSAREAARAVHCRSNLRQVALGAVQYLDAYRCFPPGSVRGYGPHVAILPYVEHQPLYDTIDFHKAQSDGAQGARGTAVVTYLCPSDGASAVQYFDGEVAGTNYAGNAGGWYEVTPFNGAFRYWASGPPLRAEEFLDGLSRTTLFAEILRANGTPARLRTNWNTPMSFGPLEIRAFEALCRGLPKEPAAHGWVGISIHRGTPWTQGNVAKTLYTHVLTPNHPSCLNGTALRSAAATSGSFHPDGINAAFADGHVELVSDTVDSVTWNELASRDGRDY